MRQATVMHRKWLLRMVAVLAAATCATSGVSAQDKKKSEYPSLEKVTEGYTEIKSSGKTGFMRLWKKSDGQMLAQLPKDYASSSHRQFIATTVSGGEIFAGLQSDDFYVYWRKYGKRVALIAENLRIQGSDDESKSSVNRIFTDRVLLDVPILTMVPRSGPVIDLDNLLVSNASTFFGGRYRPSRSSLIEIKKAKVFPKNIEVAFEVPMSGGNLKTLHYSISKIEGTKGYKPRKADQRVGYFTTSYSDYGKYERDDTKIRYINRWHLEKRDSSLKLSPAKDQIIFYIEHTTPVRYRRWVRQGILNWNKAFEQVGILNAIEVRQQDKKTGEFMDLDPEDVQYNFVRWLNNDVSTAIGPSRVHPKTGQILDADIVLTDGWIRVFEDQFDKVMPKVAMQSFTPETLAWFAKHPNWDPRVRLAPPAQREYVRQSLMHEAMKPQLKSKLKTKLMGDEVGDGLEGRTSEVNGACMAAEGRGYDVALMRMMMAFGRQELKAKAEEAAKKVDDKGDDKKEKEDKEKDEDKEEEEEKEQMLDGMPESFIGPLLADLVSHEVGHTLGLRHNFVASSLYTLAEMNSKKLKGKKPFAASVMDYVPTNFNFKAGKIQGDYAMIGVGPYDMWAIEYGYSLDSKKLPKILERVAEPALAYATDEDTSGPDPLARRYDFSKNPLDFAEEQIRLANYHRGQILEKFVEDGDSWDKARRGYLLTLRMQTQATSMMANWIGGTHVYRHKKGDKNGKKPLEVVEAEKQRDALNFVLENTMRDEAFGLTPELLIHMTSSSWRDERSFGDDAAWPVHDRIMSLQASALSQVMNPTTLRRVFDNEFRVPSDEDALTIVELMNAVTEEVWSELSELPEGEFSERNPAISSLRRNLQSEHLDRLFDLANDKDSSRAAMKSISKLATNTLKSLHEKVAKAAEKEGYDAYTQAHLSDSRDRIKKWVDSLYVVNNGAAPSINFGSLLFKEGNDASRN